MSGTSGQLEYAEFRQQYEQQHPASVPVMDSGLSEYPVWLSWVVLAMFICAALLSGVHTVPTAYATIEKTMVSDIVRQVVASGSFVFVELGILVSAYILFKNWSWWAFLILVTCILIAVVANLYSVSNALDTADIGAKIVGIALGIGAPAVASMAGKVYVSLHKSDRAGEYRAKQQYAEDCKAFDVMVNEAWDRYQKSGKRTRGHVSVMPSAREELSVVSASALSATDTNGHGYGQGYSREADARTRVREHLANNPEDANMSVRALAEKIDLKKTVVAEELARFKRGERTVIDAAQSVINNATGEAVQS